jgi:kanamycin nucleotidyltransferase
MRKATHEERITLAQQLCDEIRDSLGDDLRAFLIYASTAKNADGSYSDVEMMAITSERYEEYCSEFMRDGIRCQVDFTPLSAAVKYAGEVDAEWPVAADQWHRFESVYTRVGDDCIERIREAAQRSLGAEKKFTHEILMAMLVGCEEIGKIMNARERNVSSDIATGLVNFAMTVLRLVGFVNRHFFQSMRNAWEDSKALSDLPKGYARLIGIVHGEVETSLEDRYNAALELWGKVQKWIAQQGICWEEKDLEMPKKKEA